jgi:hypothetical protein
MKKLLAIVLLLFPAACIPDQGRTAADAEFNACVANGGDVVHITDPGSFYCEPAENEKQRQGNLAALDFDKKCGALGGYPWENSDLGRSCTTNVPDSMKRCETSEDCTGSCIKLDMMEPQGFCGPARPLLGCFIEWGSPKQNRICAGE